MTYKQISKNSSDVVTRIEVKAYLKLTTTSEDALIDSLIKAATTQAEKEMNRDILTTTWENYRDKFFEDLTLRRGGFQSVVQIEYLIDGSYVVLDSAGYTATIGGIFGKICEIDVPDHATECNLVKITFKTGFGDTATSVPEDIKTAIMQQVVNMFTHRGDCDNSGVGLLNLANNIYSGYRIVEAC